MIAVFDKQTLNALRVELNATLADFASKHGITLQLGNISFRESEFTAKLEAKIVGAKTFADMKLERMMVAYSLGRLGRDNRVLVGLNPKAHRYPFVYEQAGKRFRCSLESAKLYFGTNS